MASIPTPTLEIEGYRLRLTDNGDGTFSIMTTIGGAPNFSDAEIPSGTINGTTGSDGNPTFTLTHPPNPPASLILSLDGQVMTQGIDYNLSGNTITYLAPGIPKTGDNHISWYRY